MKAATSTAKLIDSFLAQRRKLIGCSKFREIAFVQARDLPFDYAT
jgi:hypothetical protein